MKMNRLLCYVPLLALIFLGCSKDQEDPRIRDIINTIETVEASHLLDSKAIIILPNAGCEGCITNAEMFIKENIGNDLGFKVILTGTTSQKNLKLKLGESVLESSDVYNDRDNYFYQSHIVDFYPVILYVENNEIVRLAEQSPNIPYALDSLHSYLLNE